MRESSVTGAVWFAAAWMCCAAASAQPAETYIALGDSLAYGYTLPETTPVSYGDQGYVAHYADWLAARSGGERPTVVNLGVPAESTASFYAGDSIGALYNLNYYPTFPAQIELFRDVLEFERNAGRIVTTVSTHLGVNDLFDVANTPGFLDLPLPEQQILVLQALGAMQGRCVELLAEIRAELPGADLIVMGYYNPYAAVPDHPLHEWGAPGAEILNALLAELADVFDARFIDLYTPFLGREAEWTSIVTHGNIHPTPEGYAAIAAQMIPAPGASLLLIIAAAAGARRRR